MTAFDDMFLDPSTLPRGLKPAPGALANATLKARGARSVKPGQDD